MCRSYSGDPSQRPDYCTCPAGKPHLSMPEAGTTSDRPYGVCDPNYAWNASFLRWLGQQPDTRAALPDSLTLGNLSGDGILKERGRT